MSPFSQPVMRPCLTIVDSGSPLTISVFTAVICFTVISKSTKHVPLRTLYTTVPALTQSELMTASPEYASTIPWSDKLVLNTVIKMQKNEFCLNFYTNGRNTKILELKSYTNEIKYRSYQTVIPIQESWIDGNICNIPFDITTALMTDKPYIFYVLPCSVIGHQVRYDYDLSTSTVAIVSIEFGAQLIAGNNVRFGIFIAGI